MSIELANVPFEHWSGTNWSYEENGIRLTNTTYIRTDYIPLPHADGMTYQHDVIVSIDANDRVYFQVERFNANKQSISNNAAVNFNTLAGYISATKIENGRYIGTLSLATFDSPAQETAYIRIIILNGYNNTTGTMIVHSISLKAVPSTGSQQPQIEKAGQLNTETFREVYSTNASFSKDGFVDGIQIIEY